MVDHGDNTRRGRLVRTRAPRSRAAAALATVLVAGVAGCATGGGGHAAPAPACTSPGVTPSGIKLGLIFPNTGANDSVLAAYRAGVDARLGVANAAGGVGGRQVSYDWADDQGQAADNLGAAQDLVRKGDFSIIELSTATAGGAAFLHASGVPVVGVALDDAWSRYRNMFTYSYFVGTGKPPSTWGVYVRAQGGRRAAVLYSALSDVSRVLAREWTSSLAAAGVASDLIEATPNVTAPSTVAAEIKAHRDDTLAGIVDTALFAQIAIASTKADPGQLTVILSAASYDQAFLDAFGKSLPGLSTFIAYAPFEQHVAPAQRFLAGMARYSPQVQPAANEIALEGWIDADITLTGLAGAGACPTRTSFMTALRATTAYDAGGLLVSPVDFQTNFGQLNLCYTFLKIAPTGTSWQVVSPAPLCGQAIR